MYQEEFEELKFNGNRGRDAFVEQVLNVVDFIFSKDKKEISELLDI